VLADNFLGPIAFEVFRSGVPCKDVPLPVKEEDGIIPHACHQLGEVFLALPQSRLGLLMSGKRRAQRRLVSRWASRPASE